jgi:ABC-2 type transport system ATP-binding protein
LADDPAAGADPASSTGAVLDPDATVVYREGRRVRLAFDPQRVTPAVLIGRITRAHPVRDLFVENPPIETIVARLYALR